MLRSVFESSQVLCTMLPGEGRDPNADRGGRRRPKLYSQMAIAASRQIWCRETSRIAGW